MAGNYTPRYGFTSRDVNTIYNRWRYLDGQENFGNFDGFCKWLSETGYKRGMHIRKHDKTKPHSPENSWFQEHSHNAKVRKEKVKAVRAIKSKFCENCTEGKCTNISDGCKPWREWFTENWNNNIHRKKPVAESNVPMVFCYEHPDLVREGIVWAGN